VKQIVLYIPDLAVFANLHVGYLYLLSLASFVYCIPRI